MTHRQRDQHRDRRAGLVPGFAAYDQAQEAAAHQAPAPAKKKPAKKAPAKKAR